MIKKSLWAASALVMVAVTGHAQDYQQSYDLQETVVTATRSQLPLKSIPQKIELVTSEEIMMSPAVNVADLLKNLVNLDILQYPGASAQVSMRGFQPKAHNRNYTLLLIDGKPAGTTNIATIPTSFIDRIEIVKGPYSVVYGSDAMGGVINVITKKPTNDRQGAVTLGVGNFAKTNISAYGAGKLSNAVSASIGFSRYVQDKDYRIGSRNLLGATDLEKMILDEKSYGDVMGNSRNSMTQIMGKLDFQLSRKWSALLSADLTSSEDIETPGNYWHSYGLSKKDFKRLHTALDIKRQSRSNTLLISPYYTLYGESNYNNNDKLRLDDKNKPITNTFIDYKELQKQYGVKVSDSHTWGDFTLLGGLDIDGYERDSKRFTDKATPTGPYYPDHSILSTALFTQGTYSIDRLHLNAGIRVDYTRFTLEADEHIKNEKKSAGYFNFTPSLGVKYYITPMINVHSSVGTAFYLPDAYKVAGSYQVTNWKGVKETYKGNPDLKPERALSFDFGLGLVNNQYVSMDVTYFQSHYKDRTVTDYAHAPEYTTYKNADSGRIQGLEIMSSVNLARIMGSYGYDLRLFANFTHLFRNTYTELDKDGNNLTRAVPFVRNTTGNFGISYNNHGGFAASLSARYIGHRLEADYASSLRPGIIREEHYYKKDGYTGKEPYGFLQHPDHVVVDLSTYYDINGHVRLGLQINNLLDENYAEKDGYNLPGRNLMGTVTFAF